MSIRYTQIDVMRVVEHILGLPSMNQTELTRMTSSSILIVKAWR
jgi:hypothetical protein